MDCCWQVHCESRGCAQSFNQTFVWVQIEEDGEITASGSDLKELQKELFSKAAPGGGARTSFSIVLPNKSAVYQVLNRPPCVFHVDWVSHADAYPAGCAGSAPLKVRTGAVEQHTLLRVYSTTSKLMMIRDGFLLFDVDRLCASVKVCVGRAHVDSALCWGTVKMASLGRH